MEKANNDGYHFSYPLRQALESLAGSGTWWLNAHILESELPAVSPWTQFPHLGAPLGTSEDVARESL